MKAKILIIDDDEKLNNLLKEYLGRFDIDADAVISPENILKDIARIKPDIIILDIMLPVMDGFEVCRIIRKEYDIPIIMLTARGDVTDRVVGLELGADDYLPKPFEPRELVARIQSVLRRTSPNVKTLKALFGNLEIDYERHSATLDGSILDLTTMEFELLALFTRNAGILLSRDTIFERIKGLDSDTFDRSIDVMVSRLRQKLHDDPKNPKFLKTVWGSGYKFIK